MNGTPNLDELTRDWTPQAKEKAMAEAKKRSKGKIEHWYCTNRNCDGKPHAGYEYKHARSDQWPPPGVDWFVWLAISGRGAGKTRSAAEWVRTVSKYVPQIAIIGRRGPDVRDTMVEGVSGLEAVCKRAGMGYEWYPSKKQFVMGNGCIVQGFSAEEPDSLRGPNQGAAWLDEPAHMPLIEEVWSNLLLGLRVPGLPGGAKVLCTTTPLPIKWLKTKMKEDNVVVRRVNSYANIDNLDETFKKNVLAPLEGTRRGRQEIYGEILEDVEGALWKNAMLIPYPGQLPSLGALERIVVAIDPAGSNNRRSDETGIVVVGRMGEYFFVLEDCSGKYSPHGWATRADQAYRRWQADAIVAEKNFGGDMVKTTIQATGTRARVIVKTATRGKQLRAEPVVALYEQAKVYHFPGLADLEEEMLQWVPGVGDSPNRVDALVWGVEELSNKSSRSSFSSPTGSIGGSTSTREALGHTQRQVRPTPQAARLFLPQDFPIRRIR